LKFLEITHKTKYYYCTDMLKKLASAKKSAYNSDFKDHLCTEFFVLLKTSRALDKHVLIHTTMSKTKTGCGEKKI